MIITTATLVSAAAVFTALVAIIANARKLWSYAVKVHDFIKSPFTMFSDIKKTLKNQDEILHNIQAELQTNGGSTIKDKINDVHKIAQHVQEMAVRADLRTKVMSQRHELGIFECEPEKGKCIWANDTLCEMFGLSRDEILGYGWLAAVEPEDRNEVLMEWQKAIENDYPYSWSYSIRNRKTGEVFEVKATSETMREGGIVYGYYGAVEKLK